MHTNGLENFWGLLKRGIKGTYDGVEPFHLFRYLDEQAFRFNERGGKDVEWFSRALGSVAGRRPTYSNQSAKQRPNEGRGGANAPSAEVIALTGASRP